MDNRKINLTLTIGLLNKQRSNNGLDLIKELMLNVKEVGAFINATLKENMALNASHNMKKYAMQFENCTLDVDVVLNPQTEYQSIQRFQLR